ncbi:restriction endonuclease subunit S [Dokdonia ponticola]|uniref:Restriction endonuclease subunit S n=1 Tax=Dokdonia ponticola TaxID=2041041 RepID=A0ABV9I2N5_9FLAO
MGIVEQKKDGYKKTKLGWIPKDWANYFIGDLIKFSGGSQPPRSTFKFKESEGYIRLIQTRDYRTNKYKTYVKESVVKKVCNKDDIMIGRYGPPIFQLFKGLEGAYNVALIKAIPNENKVIRDYAWYFLNRRDLRAFLESLSQRSGGQTGIEMDALKKYPFPIPSIPEQQKIASILSSWDNAIETTQTLINKLETRKKGLMQQLLTGKLRLDGFEDKWKKVNIGQIATQFTDKNKADEVIEVLSCTKYDGLVRSLDYFGRKVFGDDLSKYKLVPKGYFAYATNHIEEGSIGYQNLMNRGLVSPMYTVFKTSEEIDDSFFFRLLKTDRMLYQYQSNMSGSIARRGGLRWNVFETLVVNIPSIKEQKEIASLFDKIDLEIAYQEKRLEQLQTQKKGLMQQLLTGQIRTKL